MGATEKLKGEELHACTMTCLQHLTSRFSIHKKACIEEKYTKKIYFIEEGSQTSI